MSTLKKDILYSFGIACVSLFVLYLLGHLFGGEVVAMILLGGAIISLMSLLVFLVIQMIRLANNE